MRVRASIVIEESCNLYTNRDKIITLSLIDVDRIVRALEKIYSRLFFRLDRNSSHVVRTTLAETFRNLTMFRDAVGKNLSVLTRNTDHRQFPGTLAKVVPAVTVMADRHDPRLASFGICDATASGAYEQSTSLYRFIYREQDFYRCSPTRSETFS